MSGGYCLKMTYSRVGPREQGKRYSKGSRKPVKVRQARERCKHLKKKYKPLTGHSEGVLNFDINFSRHITVLHESIFPPMGSIHTRTREIDQQSNLLCIMMNSHSQ